MAAIDNLTRNSIERRPLLSRFVGLFFAGGHTLMILTVAAVVGYFGVRFTAQSELINRAGAMLSIVALLTIAALNVVQLSRGQLDRISGAKTRLLPRFFREAASPWIAIPVGVLFGLGFETSSQVAAYAVVFGADAGVAGAILVGSMFCVGMVCTDTLDSVFIHHLITYRAGTLPRVMRVWILAVTAFALAVAVYQIAQFAGWRPPVSDLAVSGILVAALMLVFGAVYASLKTSTVPAASPRRGE